MLVAGLFAIAPSRLAHGQVQNAARPLSVADPVTLRSAQALVDRKQYDQAEHLLRTLLSQDPHLADALYLLALVQQGQNRPVDSLRTYTVAAAARKPNAEELRLAALNYVLLNDYPDAGHWLERSVQADPKNAESLYDLARVRMHDGRFSEAAALLHRSLGLRPASSKAWDNLGVCMEAQNDPEAAIEAYRRAVASYDSPGPASAQPFVDYGTLLNTRNGFTQAVPLLQRAVALAPTNASAYAELGRAYQGVGNGAEALRAMEQAVVLDDRNSRYHYQLGRMYRAAGQVAKAQEEFSKSASLYGGTSAE